MASSPSSTSTPVNSSGHGGRTSRSAPRSSGRAASSHSSPSSTVISPARLSRQQEKEELQHLNDRFANYIQHSMELERQRSAMALLLDEKEESKTREISNVRRLYEKELADTRKSLDEMANDRARLELEVGKLSEELTKLRARSQKEERDLAHALTEWRNLEEAFNQKEADYNTQLAKSKRLTADVAELQAQQKHLDAVLADTRTQLNSEMLRRVDLENRMQTLQEQLDFERNIGKEEVHEMRRKHESRMVEVDSGRRAEFDTKLAEAMQQLRREHDAQIGLYKAELERNFNAKLLCQGARICSRHFVQENISAQDSAVSRGKMEETAVIAVELENAKQTALRKGDTANATHDELTTTKVRVETLNTQLQLYQKEKASLEGRVQDLERTLDNERELWSQRLAQKEQDMHSLQDRMNRQLEDYESLLDVKLALDMEISAYRRMLEGEEKRLQLSPSPIPHAAGPRTHAHGARRLKGKKRKMEDSSGGAPAYKMSTNSSARGPVSIDEVDVEGNYVVLKNNSDEEQPLGGWVVRRTHPSIANVSFHIPPSCVLHGGQTLTIWAADAEIQADPANMIMQGHKSWGPVTDVRVILLTPDQEETAERHVVCVQATGEDEAAMFSEEYMEGCEVRRLRRADPSAEASCAVM